MNTKNVQAMIPVSRQVYTMKGYAGGKAKSTSIIKAPQAIRDFGGKLNPAGIPTYASRRSGNPSESGVFASGRRAKPTGFGSKGVANARHPVGSKSVVRTRKRSTPWW
jgi:hypothetical protein